MIVVWALGQILLVASPVLMVFAIAIWSAAEDKR
jgi:hypothetical protein